MAAFLLWNVQKKPLDGSVQNIVRQHRIDVVFLVEYAFESSQLPGLLMSDGLLRRPSSSRFGVFVRENQRLIRSPCRLGNRVNMWMWISPSGTEGLVALLHGLDRRNYDDSTRRVFLRRVADAVRRRERGTPPRTIIVGDFNAHPFESAVTDSDGLHAIGIQAVAGGTTRTIRGADERADFFYNPMWRTYGHRGHPAAGAATHYWVGKWAHELGWFMLDQVVLRPGESANFPEDQLRIVTTIGDLSLLNAEGLPDASTASDHLPIVFHWDL